MVFVDSEPLFDALYGKDPFSALPPPIAIKFPMHTVLDRIKPQCVILMER